MFFLFVLQPLATMRQAVASDRLFHETTWKIDDETINIISPHADIKVDWGTFYELMEIKEYFLLRYTANRYLLQILPKRAFELPQQMNEFRTLVNARLAVARAQMKKVSWFKRHRLQILVYFFLGVMILIMIMYSFINSSY
jgi:hypothetical protein